MTGPTAHTPAPNGVQGMVFGLKTVTAPVPGGTIGGETRRVYVRTRRAVKRLRQNPVGKPAGSEVYPEGAASASAGGLSLPTLST
jgi:hypothetical protein